MPEVVLEPGVFKPTDPDNPLGQFTDAERKIIQLKHDNPNLDQSQIGKLLGVSPSAINKHFRNAELAAVIAYLDKDLFAKIHQDQLDAEITLRTLMMDPL